MEAEGHRRARHRRDEGQRRRVHQSEASVGNVAAADPSTPGEAGIGGSTVPQADPWIEVRGLTKAYAGAQALAGVDFDVWRGQVHGLVGANGAGKTTLVRCLAGLVAPDAGTIRVGGMEVEITSPQVARRFGLAFIHQELNLVPHFSGLANILLGRPKRKRLGIVDWRATRRDIQGVLDQLGISFSLEKRVDELSVAQRWLLSIGRALVGKATMIAMDEPTASLSSVEADRVHEVVRDPVAQDIGVIYVSHRLAEVLDLSDTISVFRDGRLTRRATRGDLSRESLVREIIGRDLQPEAAADAAARAEQRQEHADRERPLLEVRAVSLGRLRNVSFTVGRGEIVGLGGLVGAGRTEVARIIAGVDRPESGEVLLDGRARRWGSIGAAVRDGVALVPEERRTEGLFLDRSVAFNLNLADMRPLRHVSWLPLLNRRRARRRARQLSEQLGIKAASISQSVGSLSGGNQQKVLIARWLTRDLNVLVLDEVSRGVDVGARSEIHAIVRRLAANGTSIIAISSEIEELVEFCDRIVVLAEGRVAGEVQGDTMTQAKVLSLCYADRMAVSA
jgi:ribose transport system ATP-binding protein